MDKPDDLAVDQLAIKIREAFWDNWSQSDDPRLTLMMPGKNVAPHPQSQAAWRAAARAVLEPVADPASYTAKAKGT
jgi:hypothetical protein